MPYLALVTASVASLAKAKLVKVDISDGASGPQNPKYLMDRALFGIVSVSSWFGVDDRTLFGLVSVRSLFGVDDKALFGLVSVSSWFGVEEVPEHGIWIHFNGSWSQVCISALTHS